MQGHAAVENVQVYGVESGAPSAALIDWASVAVYVVPPASWEVGVSVAVCDVALYVTVAATDDPDPAVNEALVIVVASIARENVALIVAARDTVAAPLDGVTAVTVGDAEVVKVQEAMEPNGVPSAAATEPLTLTVYVVLGTSCEDGVSVAVNDGESYETVP